jgi:AcrR family transcriptional regulator
MLAMPNAPVRFVQSRSRERCEAVLDAAMSVLIDEGSAGFSMRKVAERAGIRIGNLQYYFPTRADLMRGLCERIAARFAQRAVAALEEAATPEARLLAVVDVHLTDLDDALGSIPVWEMWAMAAHDRSIAIVMLDFYQELLDLLTRCVRDVRPRLSAGRARHVATLIVALVEGSGLFDAHGRPSRGRFGGLRDEVRRAVKLMLGKGGRT